MEKKQFKYYAIRVANMIIFRRTVNKLRKVQSRLYKPNTEFSLAQITYTGGKVVGCMPYANWVMYTATGIRVGGWKLVTRDRFRALDPYITKVG